MTTSKELRGGNLILNSDIIERCLILNRFYGEYDDGRYIVTQFRNFPFDIGDTIELIDGVDPCSLNYESITELIPTVQLNGNFKVLF
jgi:hypothetical protein